MECPICHVNVGEGLGHHMFQAHTETIVTWYEIQQYSLQNIYDLASILDFDDAMVILSVYHDDDTEAHGVPDVDAVTTETGDAVECPICMEPCAAPRTIKQCHHGFCDPCIRTWLSKNNTCPMCRVHIVSRLSTSP